MLHALALMIAAASGPGAQPSRHFSGAYRSGFETSSFEGCWVAFTTRGGREYDALRQRFRAPARRRISHLYQMEFYGTRQEAAPGQHGFGHLDTARCLITVGHIIRLRPIEQ